MKKQKNKITILKEVITVTGINTNGENYKNGK